MTYTTDDLERMENLFAVDPTLDVPYIGYDIDEECIVLDHVLVSSKHSPYSELYQSIAIPKFYPKVKGHTLEGTISRVAKEYSKDDWQIPSFPLYLTILKKIAEERIVAEKNHCADRTLELMKYMQSSESVFNIDELKACNTIIDYDKRKVIHYPVKGDMPDGMDEPGNNSLKRYETDISFLKFEECKVYEHMPDDMADFFHAVSMLDVPASEMLTKLYSKGDMDLDLRNTLTPRARSGYKGISMPRMNSMVGIFNIMSNWEFDKPSKIPLFKVLE